MTVVSGNSLKDRSWEACKLGSQEAASDEALGPSGIQASQPSSYFSETRNQTPETYLQALYQFFGGCERIDLAFI
jgi:hypothetical protein